MKLHCVKKRKILTRHFFLCVLSLVSVFAKGITYTVTEITDDGSGVPAGSLSWAINEANGNPGADLIDFKIGGGGPHVIDITGPLPAITDNDGVTIDGWANVSDPGIPNTVPAMNVTSVTPLDPIYSIILNNSTNSVLTGLTVASDKNIIQGLVLQNFGAPAGAAPGSPTPVNIGIYIEGSNNQVLGCYIGLDYTGTTRGANTYFGIVIVGHDNIVGDGTAAGTNLISGLNIDLSATGNLPSAGILITSARSYGNIVNGNIIGLQADGTTVVAGAVQHYGIYITDEATDNYITGDILDAEQGNVISGNVSSGISIDSKVGINYVRGNIIGPQANGTTLVASNPHAYGVDITNGSPSNSIGGILGNYRNVISGNEGVGININGDGNTVEGNYIGLAKDGASIIASSAQDYGIEISGSSNIIGGDASLFFVGNVISGNTFSGLFVTGSSNTIASNIIGPRTNGTTYVTSNPQLYGIVFRAASGNTVGGISSDYRNIISANETSGIFLGTSSSTNIISGNYIGLDINGTTIISSSSQDYGIEVGGSASSNIIGGLTAGEKNVISGNTYGVYITSTSGTNTIKGNTIGPRTNGSAYVTSNPQAYGVYISSSPNNIIGGSAAGSRNIISANETCGTYITGASATGNLIKGNYIGLSSDGTTFITTSSQDFGVFLTSSAGNNTIGGTTAGDGNVISGNGIAAGGTGYGIYTNSGVGNTFVGNIIGPRADGITYLNQYQEQGIYISGSPNNTIGGNSSGARNTISAHRYYGIYIIGAGSTGNVIKGNYIGPASNGTSFITSSAQQYGVYFNSNITNITIGGTAAGEGNLIAGNWSGLSLGATNSNITIQGNLLGAIQANGTSTLAGATCFFGINLLGSTNNTIGGTGAARNIISNNSLEGILIQNGSSGNTIKGNYIGTNINGTAALGTQPIGILLNNNLSVPVTIGGTGAGEGNLISGNTSYGIQQLNPTAGTTIVGNYIGTASDGSSTLSSGSQQYGVYISSSPGTIIGGSASGSRNVISANTGYGIYATGATSNGTVIKGNYIGLGTDGVTFISGSSQDYGIYFTNVGAGNTIGGTVSGEGNLISGQNNGAGSAAGFYCTSATAIGSHTVVGNIIGAQKDGSTYVASNLQHYGVYISTSSDNSIGGTNPGAKNIISGNETYGIYITGSTSTGNYIQGNYIGANSSGAASVSSAQNYGITLASNATINYIGNSVSGGGNLISGNGTAGIYMTGTTATTGNYIFGNIIGAQKDGSTEMGSNAQKNGIFLSNGRNNIIGGSTSLFRNIISGNLTDGIEIGANASGNVIKGNYIGLASDGASVIAGSSQDYGIYVNQPGTNLLTTIGGTTAGEGNVISGNTLYGINLENDGKTNVISNIIGLRADGSTFVTANPQQGGIYMFKAYTNTIGGTSTSYRNIISGNTTYGVFIDNSCTTNTIVANNIGCNAAGAAVAGSDQDYGIYIPGSGITSVISGNTIAHNSTDGILISSAGGTQNLITRCLIYGNGSKAINLNSVGNANYAFPVINTNYSAMSISGTAGANDSIEIFKKVAGGSNHCQQAQVYLGSALANGSGVWTFSPGGTILNFGDTPIATARNTTTNNTSEFGCPSTAVGLPIELLSFNADKINTAEVKTYWQTATEINNDYFTIEKSKNGIEFEEAGIVNGAGNSSSVNSYQLIDHLSADYYVLPVIYYRLKQTDFDGSYSYSNIVAINLNANFNFELNIYPNPTESNNVVIYLIGEPGEKVHIALRDVLAKELYSANVILSQQKNTITLSEMFALVPGVYTISASNNNLVMSNKIIVK